MNLTPLKPSHINEAVDIHLKAFPDFFLSFLGRRFLRVFYNAFCEDDKGLGFVVFHEDNKIVGVVVGCSIPDGFFKRLLIRKWYAFAFASLGAVIKKPSVIRRLLRAVFYRGESPSDTPRALLSSIAVDPDIQRGGVGQLLVQGFLQEIERRGVAGCYLTTDQVGNESVNRFYQKLGWVVSHSYETPEGRLMNLYTYDF